MADIKGSNHRAGWDHLSPEDFGSAVAPERHAREAEATKRAKRRHHAKWIAINLALIAITGWLYANVLIPRFIVGYTNATRVGPDQWIADRTEQPSADGGTTASSSVTPQTAATTARVPTRHPSQERPRQRREPRRATEYVDAESLRIIDAECIAGTVVRRKVVNGVQEIANIPGMTCG